MKFTQLRNVILLGFLLGIILGAILTATGYAQSGNAQPLAVVSAANYGPFLAPDSIAAGFSTSEIASGDNVAPLGPSLPFELGGARAYVAGNPAGLFYVGPRQVNFHVPASTPLGLVSVEVYNRSGVAFLGSIYINGNAPSLFTFSNNGDGEAAAWYLSFGAGSNVVFAVLYGTGIATRVNAPFAAGVPGSPVVTNGRVSLVANGKEYPAQYAGPAPLFTGEQQINVPLPRAEFTMPRLAYLRVCDLAGLTCWSSNVVKIVVR